MENYLLGINTLWYDMDIIFSILRYLRQHKIIQSILNIMHNFVIAVVQNCLFFVTTGIKKKEEAVSSD